MGGCLVQFRKVFYNGLLHDIIYIINLRAKNFSTLLRTLYKQPTAIHCKYCVCGCICIYLDMCRYSTTISLFLELSWVFNKLSREQVWSESSFFEFIGHKIFLLSALQCVTIYRTIYHFLRYAVNILKFHTVPNLF